jgi:hypothetical protein
MVDALASGASIGNDVEVRVLSWAPKHYKKYMNIKFLLPVGGFVIHHTTAGVDTEF